MKNFALMLFALIITMGAPVNGQTTRKANKEKAVHIVLFKFKEGTTATQLQGLEDEILQQKGTVPGLIDISFGQDFTSRAKGYTHAEVAVFKDRKALEEFNASDYHQKLIRTHIKPVLADILVVEYGQKK